MKIPISPRKPILPTCPVKTFMVSEWIATINAYESISLQNLLSKVPDGVKREDVFFKVEEYDSVKLIYNSTEPNHNYNNELKAYNKKFIKYEQNICEYRSKLAQYKIDKKVYDFWNLGRQKIKKEKEIILLEQQIRKLKK